MAGVGPGTAVAGRYQLRTIAHRAPMGQRWDALDTATGQPVSILLVPSSAPVAAAVTDAARRAAALEDSHLAAVVATGTDEGHAYVVEDVVDAPTLRDALDDGPLAPEEARRITGECALVLEKARQRGLHHEELTPEKVTLRPDGSVRLRGLAVDAALSGSTGRDGRVASRTDAAALTGLLYAGLTGLWPLAGSTLPSAPRVGRTLVRPSELAAGVPDDLDAVAIGSGPAPAIPGDVADRLGEWSAVSVGRVVEAGPAADTEAPRAEGPLTPEALPDELRDDIEHPPSKAAIAAGAAVAAAAASSRRSAAAARAAARAAAERAATRRRESAERRVAERESVRTFSEIAGEVPSDGAGGNEPVVPVLAKDVPTGVPSRRQAQFVLGCMGVFVATCLLLGVLGIAAMTHTISSKVAAGSGPAPTRTVTAPAVTVVAKPGGGVVTPSAAPTSTGGVVPIVGTQSLDPYGDGNEHPETVDRVRDGDPTTFWTSSQYLNATFSDLKKGVGILVDLGQKSAVRTVTLTIPTQGTGEDITVYSADEPPTTGIDGLPVIGTAPNASGTVTLTTTGTPAEHQYVVVWFTKAVPTNGKYMVSLAEVALSS